MESTALKKTLYQFVDELCAALEAYEQPKENTKPYVVNREGLVKYTGFSRGTCTRLINEMEAAGYPVWREGRSWRVLTDRFDAFMDEKNK